MLVALDSGPALWPYRDTAGEASSMVQGRTSPQPAAFGARLPAQIIDLSWLVPRAMPLIAVRSLAPGGAISGGGDVMAGIVRAPIVIPSGTVVVKVVQ